MNDLFAGENSDIVSGCDVFQIMLESIHVFVGRGPGYLVEQQCERLFLVRVFLFQFLLCKEFCKWHHRVLHVHDASFLLVNVRGIDDQTL